MVKNTASCAAEEDLFLLIFQDCKKKKLNLESEESMLSLSELSTEMFEDSGSQLKRSTCSSMKELRDLQAF